MPPHRLRAIFLLLLAFPAAPLPSQQTPSGASRQGSLRLAHPVPFSLADAPEFDDPAAAAGTTVRVTADASGLPAASYLTLRWRPDDLPAGVTGSEMVAVRLVGSEWRPERMIAHGDDSVTVAVNASGVWAVHWGEPAQQCTGDGYHAIDFRIGRWSYVAAGYTPGTSVVTATRTHCALRDDYVDEKGGRSRTFFRFDPASGKWFNTTIDPGGRSRSTGIADSSGITFYSSPTEREQYLRAGDSIINYAAGQSSDGGATWRVTAAARYTRLPTPKP